MHFVELRPFGTDRQVYPTNFSVSVLVLGCVLFCSVSFVTLHNVLTHVNIYICTYINCIETSKITIGRAENLLASDF